MDCPLRKDACPRLMIKAHLLSKCHKMERSIIETADVN